MEHYAKEQQVLQKLEENGWEAWFVGGCVRDALRGEPCDDIDITTKKEATNQCRTARGHGCFWCRKYHRDRTGPRHSDGEAADGRSDDVSDRGSLHRSPSSGSGDFRAVAAGGSKTSGFYHQCYGDGLPGHSGRSFWRPGRFKKRCDPGSR